MLEIENTIKSAVNEAGLIKPENMPKTFSKDNFFAFIDYVKYAVKVTFSNLDILIFAFLQVVIVIAAYYLWIRLLQWAPHINMSNNNTSDSNLFNLILWLYGVLCLIIASYPIGILSGCMGASVFLKNQGKPYTIAECFKIVIPRSTLLWEFTAIDGYITVSHLLHKFDKHKTNTIIKAIAYYSWKIGSLGILPSILTGHTLLSAGKESVVFVRDNFKQAVLLRGGYTLFCGIVGITTYILSIFYFMHTSNFDHLTMSQFYTKLGVPLIFAVTIILVFLRPVYIIACCKLYSDYVTQNNVAPVNISPGSRGIVAFVVFMVLVAALVTILVFHHALGIDALLRSALKQ